MPQKKWSLRDAAGTISFEPTARNPLIILSSHAAGHAAHGRSFLFGNVRDCRADREIVRGDRKRIRECRLRNFQRIDDAGFFEVAHLIRHRIETMPRLILPLAEFVHHAIRRFAAVRDDCADGASSARVRILAQLRDFWFSNLHARH